MLEALDGDPRVALVRADHALAAGPDRSARGTWELARAHALAKIGALEEARAALLSLRVAGGESVLHRVIAQDGPASRLAESLASEQGAYR